MDRKGYVRIVGRAKEIIIRGGTNIYPREIEEILIKNPYIAEAAVSNSGCIWEKRFRKLILSSRSVDYLMIVWEKVFVPGSS